MKRTKIIYWIITGLFLAFMAFSAIPDLLLTQQAHDFMIKLGYSDTVTRFLGLAKLLGIIAILIPGFPRIKEWAYAGLFFDLLGAAVSMAGMPDGMQGVLFIIMPIAFLFLSYYFYHRIRREQGLEQPQVRPAV